MKKRSAKFLLALIFSLIASQAMGAGKPLPPPGAFDLVVELKNTPSLEDVDNRVIDFQSACGKFGVFLSGNRGLWGTGPFMRVICQASSVSGAKETKSGNPWTWKLTISTEQNKKSFTINYKDRSGKVTQESSYSVDTPIGALALMDQPRVASLIAAHLAMGLPYRSIIRGSLIREGKPSEWIGRNLPNIPPPKTPLQIFKLRRIGNIWQPIVVANGQIAQESPTTTSITFQIPLPEFTDDSRKIIPNIFYFAHQVSDRDSARIKLHEALLPELDTYFKESFDIGRSVYVGTRYGIPMLKGTSALTKSPVAGASVEFRGGRLSGLKLRYDVIAKQKMTTPEATEEASWSRFQATYGLGTRFDLKYFDWIDIAFSFGMTSLQVTNTPAPDSSAIGYEFEVPNAPFGGFEMGLERRRNDLLYRLWFARGSTLGLFKVDKKFQSTSMRFGFDAYKELFSMGTLNFAVLGFTAFESASFKKIISPEEKILNPDETTSISYGSFYLGGGLTLAW